MGMRESGVVLGRIGQATIKASRWLTTRALPGAGGGRGGIRTLEAELPPTRFPVARTRPGYATLPYRRGWDSNPRRLITSPLFESGTFNHSDTSPTWEVYQRGSP